MTVGYAGGVPGATRARLGFKARYALEYVPRVDGPDITLVD